ncbi:MAG: 50S ribosomal protein L10, partial [Candidatus Njordarchaeales archaeon]
MVYKRKKPIPPEKVRKLERIKKLLEKYSKFLIIDFHEVSANLMHKLRSKLRGKAEIVVIKNTLTEKAIDELSNKKPDLVKMKEYLTGMRAFVFTEGDLFEIARMIAEEKEIKPPTPGKISPIDIVIPKGSTGLRPGPAMTDLRLAGLPVRIIEGELFIMEDTVLVRKGQRLSSQVVKVLQILDIHPFEVSPKVICAYDNGIIIRGEILLKPIEEYEEMIAKAISEAMNIAVNLAIPVPEAIENIIRVAYMHATSLAIETAIPLPDTAEHLLARAMNIARALVSEIAKEKPEILPKNLKKLAQAPAAPAAEAAPAEEKKEEEKKEEKKEEEKKEEESLAGL